MVWGTVSLRLIAVAGAMLAAGCTQTSRVDDNLSTASLNQTKKAVAVMRVGAASPSCINVAVLLGVREGEGFRRHQGLTVMNVRSLTEPAVAEVELDPGEYHVIAYRCQTAKGDQDGGRRADPGTYRTSYASFIVWSRRDRQRRLSARRGLAPRPLHVRPADEIDDRRDGLAACRARPLQGQAPAHLRADEDAPDDGDAPGARPADQPGLRQAQDAEGRGQGAGASRANAAGPVGQARAPAAAVAKQGGN